MRLRQAGNWLRRNGMVGVSSFYGEPGELGRALGEAELVLDVLRRSDVPIAEDIGTGTYRLLFRVLASHPEEVRSFYDDTVAPLVAYDALIARFANATSADMRDTLAKAAASRLTCLNRLQRQGVAVDYGAQYEDLSLAERFGTLSGEDTDKFEGIDVDVDENGVPLLEACPNRLSLERLALLDDGSDHVCLTARVSSAHAAGSFEPLRVSRAIHLDPGHGNEERAIDP